MRMPALPPKPSTSLLNRIFTTRLSGLPPIETPLGPPSAPGMLTRIPVPGSKLPPLEEPDML